MDTPDNTYNGPDTGIPPEPTVVDNLRESLSIVQNYLDHAKMDIQNILDNPDTTDDLLKECYKHLKWTYGTIGYMMDDLTDLGHNGP